MMDSTWAGNVRSGFEVQIFFRINNSFGQDCPSMCGELRRTLEVTLSLNRSYSRLSPDDYCH